MNPPSNLDNERNHLTHLTGGIRENGKKAPSLKASGEVFNKIAIFPGSFNPIHIGHLLIAESARVQFNLDKIYFVLSPFPPHKPSMPDLMDFETRKEILKASIQNNPHFEIDTREINRKSPSYTIETVKEIKKEKNIQDYLTMIIGMDSFLTLSTWYKPDLLAEECEFLVAARPGWSAQEIKESCSNYHQHLNWDLIDCPSLAVSSSEIRRRKEKHESFRYLMVDPGFEVYK